MPASSLNTNVSADPEEERILQRVNGLDLLKINKMHLTNTLMNLAYHNPEVNNELKARVTTKAEYKECGIGKLRYAANAMKAELEKDAKERKERREKRKAEKLAAGESISSSEDEIKPIPRVKSKKGKGKGKKGKKAHEDDSDSDEENSDDPDAEAEAALKKRNRQLEIAAKKLNQPLIKPQRTRSPSVNSDKAIDFKPSGEAFSGGEEHNSDYEEAVTMPLGLFALENKFDTGKHAGGVQMQQISVTDPYDGEVDYEEDVDFPIDE